MDVVARRVAPGPAGTLAHDRRRRPPGAARLRSLPLPIGSQRRVPPPFGPAANGVVAVSHDGNIYVRDVAAGTERLIVGGDELDVGPIFSRDGRASRSFGSAPDEAADGGTVFVASTDGSGPRALFGPDHIQGAAWSPGSDKLAIIAGEEDPSLWIVPADGSDPTGPLDLGDVTPYSDVLWRPPDGRELVFKGVEQGLYSIYSVPVDGSTPPRRLAHQGTERGFAGAYSASPDGTQLTYTQVGDSVWIYVVDLEAGVTRPFGAALPALPNWAASSPQHSGGAMFSPDGTQILFGRYWDDDGARINHQLWITGSAGDGADAYPVGPLHRSRGGHDPFWYTFAPDGKNALILGNESEEAWLAPVDRSDPNRSRRIGASSTIRPNGSGWLPSWKYGPGRSVQVWIRPTTSTADLSIARIHPRVDTRFRPGADGGMRSPT